jgi:hypothetical protein
MRCSAHTIKHSDFLPSLPRCFVSSLRGTANAPWTSLPRPQGATAAGLGLFTGSPKPVSLTETTGPPRFLEDPAMNVPCSSTPAGPLRSATTALRCCLSLFGRRRTPATFRISGLNHTARALAVYASQSGLPTAAQDSLPDRWPAFPGGTDYPLGPNEGFRFIPSSFPRLRLAHPNSGENSTPLKF